MHPSMKPLSITAMLILGLMAGTTVAARSDSPSIAGTWHGSGSVSVDGRPQEAISCKARVTLKAGNDYFSNFSCSMKSHGKGSQVANFTRKGNRLTGGFMIGQDRVRLTSTIHGNGSSQTVKIGGKRWKGHLKMMK